MGLTLNILIILLYLISILTKIFHKYTGFMIILVLKFLIILHSLGDKFYILSLTDSVLDFHFYIVLMSIILSFSLLLISFFITANFKILYFLKNVSFKLIDIKNIFLILFIVFIEEIYFRIFTLPLFVYFFNSELSAISFTSMIFVFYHVDKVKYTTRLSYLKKIIDLFVFSILLSVVFILTKNFWIIFFIHFSRNIVLTGIVKSLSDSKLLS